MNKGFFVVFLGIIIGAMALIFFNQTSVPVVDGGAAQKAAPHVSDVVAAKPESRSEPVAQPEPVAKADSEPVAPAPTIPEPVAAPVAQPETVTPAPQAPSIEPEPDAQLAQATQAAPETAAPEARMPEPAPVQQPAVVPAVPVKEKPVTAPVAQPQGKFPVLKNIGLHFKGNGMALRIEADRQFSYKTFVLPTPDRYVVDFPGTWENLRVPKVPSNQLIKSVRLGKQSGGPRMVMDLHRAPRKHTVVWLSPTVLEIQVE